MTAPLLLFGAEEAVSGVEGNLLRPFPAEEVAAQRLARPGDLSRLAKKSTLAATERHRKEG
jgi:hypothetical protein